MYAFIHPSIHPIHPYPSIQDRIESSHPVRSCTALTVLGCWSRADD